MPGAQPLGRPVVGKCDLCGECAHACPTSAITIANEKFALDLGRCIFCGACANACKKGTMKLSDDLALASLSRKALVYDPRKARKKENVEKSDIASMFGSSLCLRDVDAGSCNGCEIEASCLSNPYYDAERLGIHFAASPRHADALFVTGPAARNMRLALKKTYDATPEPKFVIACGACAISGGMFRGSYATMEGIEKIVPVAVYVPGCPPSPTTLIHGLMLALGRLKELEK